MANSTSNTTWERIKLGLRSTERLMEQKDYNSAMIKARQTLEFMVKMRTDRTGSLNDGDLKDMIDLLYRGRRISKSTCDNYHKIRMIGNKAAHEGNDSSANASLALQLLSQEARALSMELKNRGQNSRRNAPRSYSSQNSRRRSGKRRNRLLILNLMKILVPLLCILVIFFVVRLIKPKSDETDTTSGETIPTEASVENTAFPTHPETYAPVTPSTEPPAPSLTYKTNDVLNVRAEPRTDAAKLGKLASGTTVDYIREENDEWTVILYDGQEAYVASQYLSSQPAEQPSPEE